MHNNLVDTVANGGLACARNAEGKIVISDMALRYLLPPQLKQMTPFYKQTCGCEMCLSAASMHQSLNAFCVHLVKATEQRIENMQERHDKFQEKEKLCLYKIAVFPQEKPLHSRASDAIKEIMCSNFEGFVFPRWLCVLHW